MIRTTSLSIAAVLLAGVSIAQFEKNRLQLDNGGDQIWVLQDPIVGSDPANGDYGGDLYYKIYPEEANIRCSGTWSWTGTEFAVFDSDWGTGAQLWDLVLSPAAETPSMTFHPDFGVSSDEILVPGGVLTWEDIVGQPWTVANCVSGAFSDGFTIRESYLDTATGALPAEFQDLPQGDWALSHFFPSGQSSTMPAMNSCGFPGDVTFGWLGSTDTNDPRDGENQPDWTGSSGASAYGGFQIGGVPGFFSESLDGGAELSLLMDGPTLNVRVDVGLEDSPFLELGLASLNPQIGIDGSGVETGTSASIGVFLVSESSKPTTNANGIGAGGNPYFGVLVANLGPTLLQQLGGCFGSPEIDGLALNPGDPLFTALSAASGYSPFSDGFSGEAEGGFNATLDFDGNGSADDGVYLGDLIQIQPSAGLVDVGISLQGFAVDGQDGTAVGSQVFVTTFRATD